MLLYSDLCGIRNIKTSPLSCALFKCKVNTNGLKVKIGIVEKNTLSRRTAQLLLLSSEIIFNEFLSDVFPRVLSCASLSTALVQTHNPCINSGKHLCQLQGMCITRHMLE